MGGAEPTYQAAAGLVQALIDEEMSQPSVIVRSFARLHGHKTRRALLIFHGVTNSPEQFRTFSELFFERGYNVFIPRHPYHGLNDRTGRAMHGYRLDEALKHATSSLEIISGLGERITVVGLSGGANLAAWLAQTRPGIDLAVIMAPALGFPAIPAWTTKLALGVVGILPDIHSWWDPRTKMENPYSPHFAYTGFMSHAIQQICDLGQKVKVLARRGPPLARRVLLITNEGDFAVNNEEIVQLEKLWAGYPGFQAYVIPKEANVEHDFITLDINAERNKALYPKLLELIDRE
jgi:carboxylesterase